MSSNVWGMSRRTMRGALVVQSAGALTPRTIVFQYNPANLRRKLEPQMIGGDAQSRGAPMAYASAPTESIDADIEVDAADQDAFVTGAPSLAGIAPQLAALEIVLYPASWKVILSQALLEVGILEIGPFAAPTTLFVWGANRIVPVKITSYSVTEEAFDNDLNPIRASIQLGMQVLSYSDVMPSDPAYPLYMAYQVAKELLSVLGSSSALGIADALGVMP